MDFILKVKITVHGDDADAAKLTAGSCLEHEIPAVSTGVINFERIEYRGSNNYDVIAELKPLADDSIECKERVQEASDIEFVEMIVND